MAGFNNAESAAALDLVVTNIRYTHIGWSDDGATESEDVARTAVTWKAATSADPSVKANDGALESAAASGACTITHWAAFSAGTEGTQRIDWTALDTAVPLIIGGKIEVADGALEITLT
jgi:hypothetical protein